jgi:hypothetical protein
MFWRNMSPTSSGSRSKQSKKLAEVDRKLSLRTDVTQELQSLVRMEINILWRIDLLLRSHSVNNSRCYGATGTYACAVMAHNNRIDDAGGVLCRSAPRLYDSTDRVLASE